MQETTQSVLLKVNEVAKVLNLGRSKVYQMVAAGELPVVRFGRAVRVSPVSLKQWVESREQNR